MNPPPKKTKISEQSFRESFREGGDLEYSNSSFDFTITIVNTFQKEVNQKLTFKDCSFKKIELFNLNFNSKIYFFNCDIDDDFIVNNCVFKESFRIFYITAKSLRIWSNDFLSGIDIYDFKKLENLILQINKALGRVHVKQWHVNPIEVQSIHITFENITECSILLEGFVSQKIEIQFSGQFLTDRIRITDFKAKELNIYKLKIKANNNVDIARIESAKVFFLWLHNDGWLSISDFKSSEEKKGTLFSIQESYFGNAELYHINLDSFEKVQIFNCHVQNIIPVNVKWNFNIKAYEGIKGEYLRELFRQLKNVCSKNMDKASQLRFESMEMHFYSKQLHWKKKFPRLVYIKIKSGFK